MNDDEIIARLRAIAALHRGCQHISNDVDANPCGVIESIEWLADRVEREASLQARQPREARA